MKKLTRLVTVIVTVAALSFAFVSCKKTETAPAADTVAPADATTDAAGDATTDTTTDAAN